MTIPTMPIRAAFDIETKRFHEDKYQMEASSVVVISTEDPVNIKYFNQDEITDSVEYLLTFPGFVGFNSKSFDMQILSLYIDRPHGRLLKSRPHFDIYDEFMRMYQRRISLGNMSRHTLNMDKWELMEATAPGLWRMDPERLRRYNAWDTYLTYLLFVHLIAFGYINFKLPTLRRFVPETISRPGLT